MLKHLFLALGLLLAVPAFAVEPDEVLDDPALETRAREISKGLRCLVCRNESIDESNADLAKELRVLVRERLINQFLHGLQAEIGARRAGADAATQAGLEQIAAAVEDTLAAPVTTHKAAWAAARAGLNSTEAGPLLEEMSAAVHAALDAPEANQSVIGYLVDRYGEYVLLKPRATGANLVLWVAGPVLLIVALGIGAGYVLTRRRSEEPSGDGLSDEEEARLKEIMGD